MIRRLSRLAARRARIDVLLSVNEGIFYSTAELAFIGLLIGGILLSTRVMNQPAATVMLSALLFFRTFQRTRALQQGLLALNSVLPGPCCCAANHDRSPTGCRTQRRAAVRPTPARHRFRGCSLHVRRPETGLEGGFAVDTCGLDGGPCRPLRRGQDVGRRPDDRPSRAHERTGAGERGAARVLRRGLLALPDRVRLAGNDPVQRLGRPQHRVGPGGRRRPSSSRRCPGGVTR